MEIEESRRERECRRLVTEEEREERDCDCVVVIFASCFLELGCWLWERVCRVVESGRCCRVEVR
jgi:hypothetical protein